MTRYRTIVADPPWPIDDFPAWFKEERRSVRERTVGFNATPYTTMTMDEIKALPVRELSDNRDADAHLYLWTIDSLLSQTFEVARAWGFHHVRTIVWCKASMGSGLGGVWPANVEYVLFCRRPKTAGNEAILAITSQLADAADALGISRTEVNAHMGTSDMAGWWLSRLETRCAIPSSEQWPRLRDLLGAGRLDDEVAEINAEKGTNEIEKLVRAPSSWFQWKRGAHSAKPEAFLDLVETVSPGPYLEMFARRNRLGWDTWGNEALNHVEMGA